MFLDRVLRSELLIVVDICISQLVHFGLSDRLYQMQSPPSNFFLLAHAYKMKDEPQNPSINPGECTHAMLCNKVRIDIADV